MEERTAPFPAKKRVVYERNPLNQVICQVRFPALLRLQAQAPFEFQEAIQHIFPVYDESQAAIEMPPQLAGILPVSPTGHTHKFRSEDSVWLLSIEPNFIALTCSEYSSWQEFESRFSESLSRFCGIYSPSFFSRIGLRYQNIIRKKWVESEVGWDKLIYPSLVGPLADRDLEDRLLEARAAMRIALGNDGDIVHLQYGLVDPENEEGRCYLLDFDYYFDKKSEIGEAENVINRLHDYSGPAFRWAITKKLHDAMAPIK